LLQAVETGGEHRVTLATIKQQMGELLSRVSAMKFKVRV